MKQSCVDTVQQTAFVTEKMRAAGKEVRTASSPACGKQLWYRLRGLDQMEPRFIVRATEHRPIQSFIEERLRQGTPVRVLEIGFGEGRALLELRIRWAGKALQLYGINKAKEGGVFSQADLQRNAEYFGIRNLPRAALPKVYFHDAGDGLPFPARHFDVVMSQVAIPYVTDKARLIEETWRVLKIGGRAFLHLDTGLPAAAGPDFLRFQETPRFVINAGRRRVSLKEHLRPFRRRGYDLEITRQSAAPEERCLVISRTSRRPLDLGLKLDAASTFKLKNILCTDEWKVRMTGWWGIRSVYDVCAPGP